MNGEACFMVAAADYFDSAIDDHLRREDATAAQLRGVVLLPSRKVQGGIRVSPTKLIPVVDMLFKCDDFGAIDGLIVAELFQKSVGGRATGTAFGSEELDDDRLFRGGRSLRRSGSLASQAKSR